MCRCMYRQTRHPPPHRVVGVAEREHLGARRHELLHLGKVHRPLAVVVRPALEPEGHLQSGHARRLGRPEEGRVDGRVGLIRVCVGVDGGGEARGQTDGSDENEVHVNVARLLRTITASPSPPAMRLATVSAGTSPWLHTIHSGSICVFDLNKKKSLSRPASGNTSYVYTPVQ